MKTEKRKHRFLGLFLLVLLLSSGFLFSFKIPPVHAADASEDFESGTVGLFSNHYSPYGVNFFSVSTEAPFSGSYGLKNNDLNAAQYDMQYSDVGTFWDNTTGDDSISFFIKMVTASYARVDFVYQTYTEASVIFKSNHLYTDYVGEDLFGDYFDNTWYLVRVLLGSVSSALFSVYVYTEDGEPVAFVEDVTMTNHLTGSAGNDDVTVQGGLASTGIFYTDDFSSPAVDPPVGYSLTSDIEPDNSGDDWVFTEWKYYTFQFTIPSYSYSGSLDYVYIGFEEILTSSGTVGFAAWSNGSYWDCAFNTVYESRNLAPIRVKTGSWSSDDDGTTITFPLWFTKSCLDIWADNCVDVLAWFNDTTGYESGWDTVAYNYFRIYTDGGFSTTATFTGDAGVLPGGRDFSLFAYNDSYAYKDMIWRDLQHIKVMPTINFRAGLQTFQVYYGFDYMLKDGSWCTGLNLRLEPDAVAYTGVFAADVWINMTAMWYYNNSLVKEDVLYMFYHGEVYDAPDPGRWQFWIDLWFDNANASSVMGGRINAYEFPMKDESAIWLRWLSSNWGVKDDVLKQSECMMPLWDSDGALISSEQIQFVKVHSALNVVPYDAEQFVAITDFSVFDTTLSREPTLKGISTPPWDETQMPVVGNTGVLGAIWSMFAGMGKWLSDNILFGGLALWPAFVSFLDTIAGWLGAPSGFSNLLTWLGTGWTWLVNSFTYALSLIFNIFLFLGSIMYAIITTLGEAIVAFVTMIGMIGGFLSGTVGGAGDLWNTLGISTWITIGIIFYPLYLIILWDQKGMDEVVKQLSMIVGILTWLKDLFMGLINLVLNLIGRIIESIPVVE